MDQDSEVVLSSFGFNFVPALIVRSFVRSFQHENVGDSLTRQCRYGGYNDVTKLSAVVTRGLEKGSAISPFPMDGQMVVFGRS
jgi:hypothetical protein